MAALAIHGASGADQHSNRSVEPGLIGWWKLTGDCRDYSGNGHDGVNHRVDLSTSQFDGRGAYIEVANDPLLKFGTGDFTLSAWIYTQNELDDVLGDIFDKYDPSRRRGITVSAYSSGSGYQGQGNDRHVCFGIDNAHTSPWEDCGRPSQASRHVSNSMVVYRGKLYAGTTDAKELKDWCHVFRYDGQRKWTDCGRLGTGRTAGAGPLLVHDGNLYGVTWTYDWTRVQKYDPGRLYRYAGGTNWIDCGQPSNDGTLNCAASFKGKIYVGGGPQTWGVFVRTNDNQWTPSKLFPMDGPRRLFPHPMNRHNGKLFVGFPCVYSFDGNEWTYEGQPGSIDAPSAALVAQIHSFTTYQGSLYAGTWPQGKVWKLLGNEAWQEVGRAGEDATEVNALAVYNGKLYSGSIPRAEVCRYDGNPRWTSLKRFYSPHGWEPVPAGRTDKEVKKWSRLTCLAIHQGKLFAGTGTCTSAFVDNPPDPDDVLGKVYSMEAGKCVSYDDDLGPGWKHLAAVRQRGQLKLYVDGNMVAKSSSFNPADYDVSTDQPLRIGAGQMDSFCGKISDVKIYNQALSARKIRKLLADRPR